MPHPPRAPRVQIVAILAVAAAAVIALGGWETQPSRSVAVAEVAAQTSAFVLSEGAVADAAANTSRPGFEPLHAHLSDAR